MVDKYDVAKRSLMSLLAGRDVSSVDFVAGPGPVAVWLITETDAEAKALRARSDTREVVSRVLRSAGMSSSHVDDFGVTVQSEETVARDFEGSWFYAMR